MTRETDLTDRIVASIAAREGTDVTDLEPPVYDAIDTEALTALVRDEAVREVEFSYLDYDVVVDRDGRVRVSEASPPARQQGKLS